MTNPENARVIRGRKGVVDTTTSGVIQTDNYDEGGVFNIDPANADYADYPLEVNPIITIQFLKVLETGTDIRADIVTKTGETITNINLRAAGFEEQATEIDSITFRDPNGTGEPTFGYYSGE